jgi:hypothetical protein
MLRNNASGPEIGLPGRILAGLLPGKHQHLPVEVLGGRLGRAKSAPTAFKRLMKPY